MVLLCWQILVKRLDEQMFLSNASAQPSTYIKKHSRFMSRAPLFDGALLVHELHHEWINLLVKDFIEKIHLTNFTTHTLINYFTNCLTFSLAIQKPCLREKNMTKKTVTWAIY